MIARDALRLAASAAALAAAPAAASALQPAVPASRPAPPVLEFPEAGLDDTAAYRGYRTRFHRDAAGNTVQVYLDAGEARVVHVLADSENESVGFTARDTAGAAASLRWTSPDARIATHGRLRTLEHHLASDAAGLRLGHFLLGSMRAERDFQAWRGHDGPFTDSAFVLPEIRRMLDALARLPADTRDRHLALVGAGGLGELGARLVPTVTFDSSAARWTARIVQPSVDARDTIAVEIEVDPRRVAASPFPGGIALRARDGAAVAFTVRVGTTAAPLSPLSREEIFTPEFLAFVAGAATDTSAAGRTRARWTERQVRGVELLVSREKLMAGLPTYGTYFGRDMLVTALMMRPIWRAGMSEFVIASALRKLSPSGQVSHEEALGGQAVREAAGEYASLVERHLALAAGGERAAADSLLARAASVLRDVRQVRENYHMIDDELQLPVLVARWMDDTTVADDRRLRFLLDSSDGGGTRLARLLAELALVARMTAPYATDPAPTRLIAFAARDSARWASTSWRDSNAGYGNGRFAMDVNAIWAPHALRSLGRIVQALRRMGVPDSVIVAGASGAGADGPLATWVRNPAALDRAIATWSDAWRHFEVRLGPAEVAAAVTARLAAMPEAERVHWRSVVDSTGAAGDSLAFMALALDADGRPVRVVNTDPATELFLGSGIGRSGARTAGTDVAADDDARRQVERDVRTFVRHYPVGLLVDAVGPVVANDAFAAPPVWAEFVRDPYHGPRVVWGREVNLFLLGVAGRVLGAAGGGAGDASLASHVRELRAAAARVQAAAEASGFQSELWSYDFVAGRPVPVRYGSGADVQLWSTTDLVVQWALSRMR